jgi:site-specific DNA-adenine methylase
MLFEGEGTELIRDPAYLQLMLSVRSGTTRDDGYIFPKGQQQFQRNTPKLLELFDEIYDTFSDVDVVPSSMKSTQFIRSLPSDLDLVLFDPPYIGQMVTYATNEYDIENYVEDVGLIHKFKHYMLFNDIVSKYLHVHVQEQAVEYVVKGVGLRVGKNRTELCYYR